MKDRITLCSITKEDLEKYVVRSLGKSINEDYLWEIIDSVTEQITENLQEFLGAAIDTVSLKLENENE